MVRFGLIGSGAWGRRIAFALAAVPRTCLPAATVGSNGNPFPPVKDRGPITFETADRLLDAAENLELDAVIIATPASMHAQLVLKAWERKLAVFVEKPMTANLQDAAILNDRWDGDSVFLCNHIQLFNPGVEDLKRLTSGNGGIVDLSISHGNYGPFRKDCSALWDYGSHDIAIALWLSDFLHPPVDIGAKSGGTLSSSDGFVETVTADMQIGEIDVSIVVSNETTKKIRTQRARCANGAVVQYDDIAKRIFYQPDPSLSPVAIQIEGSLPLVNALRTFARAVETGTCPNDMRFGTDLPLEVVRTLDAIDTSLLSRGIMRPQKQGPTIVA